jgi:hypothetical protein
MARTLLKAVQSTLIGRYGDLKIKLKHRKATDYAGQNINNLSMAYRKDAAELTSAGQYDHNLTHHILKTFLEAGGCSNESYRFELHFLKKSLDAVLLAIGHMSKNDATRHMTLHLLTYKHICIKAKDEYHKQAESKEWSPARPTTDSKAPPSNFGTTANVCMKPGSSLFEAHCYTITPVWNNLICQTLLLMQRALMRHLSVLFGGLVQNNTLQVIKVLNQTNVFKEATQKVFGETPRCLLPHGFGDLG